MHYEQIFVDRRMRRVNEYIETSGVGSRFGRATNGVIFFQSAKNTHRLPLRLHRLWGDKFSGSEEMKALILALGKYIEVGSPVATELLGGAGLADFVQLAISAGIASRE